MFSQFSLSIELLIAKQSLLSFFLLAPSISKCTGAVCNGKVFMEQQEDEEYDIMLDLDFIPPETEISSFEILNVNAKAGEPLLVKINNSIYKGVLRELLGSTIILQADGTPVGLTERVITCEEFSLQPGDEEEKEKK